MKKLILCSVFISFCAFSAEDRAQVDLVCKGYGNTVKEVRVSSSVDYDNTRVRVITQNQDDVFEAYLDGRIQNIRDGLSFVAQKSYRSRNGNYGEAITVIIKKDWQDDELFGSVLYQGILYKLFCY